MVTETRTFTRLGLLSIAGLVFYYAHLFLGMVDNAILFRMLAITFLAVTIPLPFIVMGNKKLFPELQRRMKNVLTIGTLLLLVHNFLMTFIFVMFLPEGRIF